MAAGDVQFAYGFELGSATYTGFFATATGGTVAVSSTQAKNGTYSLRINRTSANETYAYWDWASTQTPDLPGTAPTTMHLSFWIYVATRPSATINIASIGGLASGNADLVMNSSGDLQIRFSVPGTLTTVQSALSTGTWHQIEMGADLSANPRKLRCRVNQGTSQEITYAVASSTCDRFWLGTNGTTASTYDIYYDDIVWTEAYSAWPGNLQCKRLVPNGDVDSNWTITGGDATRAAAIDDVPVATGTYISSSTASQVQRVDLGTYTLGTNESFVGLTAWGVMGSTATTARSATMVFQNSGGTDHATTASWSAAFNGWSINTANYTVITAPGGGSISQSVVDGLRLKATKDATTRAVRMSDAHVLAVVKYSPPVAQALTATLSFTSAQTRLTKKLKTLTATASFTSAQTRKVKATDTATLSFTSAQAKKVKATDTATLSFTSAQAKKVKATDTATLSFTSSGVRKPKRALTAALSFTSAQTKKVKDTLTAALSFTSAQTKKATRLLTAALSFTSAQTRQTVADTIQQALTATLSFTSAQTRKAKKTLTASWSGSGALTRRTAYRQALTGAVSFTSSQSKKAKVTLNAATLSFTGAITRRVRVAYAAAGSFSGELLKKVRKTLTATLSFSGSNSQTPVAGPPPATVDSGLGWFIRWKRRRHED